MELRDSHFMPAELYKIARDESRVNPNPVLVREEMSPQQATDRLLCASWHE